jgi:nucleotide-binding universal stress UspA family protein
MPDHPHMLTSSARRALAATMIAAATDLGTETALTVADALDLVSFATLRAAGVSDPAQARAVLHVLWNIPGAHEQHEQHEASPALTRIEPLVIKGYNDDPAPEGGDDR